MNVIFLVKSNIWHVDSRKVICLNLIDKFVLAYKKDPSILISGASGYGLNMNPEEVEINLRIKLIVLNALRNNNDLFYHLSNLDIKDEQNLDVEDVKNFLKQMDIPYEIKSTHIAESTLCVYCKEFEN